MVDWPVGLSTGCFYKRSLFECLEQVRNAGFGIVEICSHPAHLDHHDLDAVKRARDLIDRLELEPYSLHAPFKDTIDITALDGTLREQALREVEQAADAAAMLGVKYLVIHPGPERSNVPREERLERMDRAAESLNRVAQYCRDRDVRLVLENMLPHLFTGPVRELLWILGSLSAQDVGICLDTGHAFLSGDLEGVVHKVSGHLWMLHVSDTHGHHDDHLPAGQGVLDWHRLLAQVAGLGFKGTLILEIHSDHALEHVLDEARHARRLLRHIMRRLP